MEVFNAKQGIISKITSEGGHTFVHTLMTPHPCTAPHPAEMELRGSKGLSLQHPRHLTHLARAVVASLHERVGPAAAPELAGCQDSLVLEVLQITTQGGCKRDQNAWWMHALVHVNC